MRRRIENLCRCALISCGAVTIEDAEHDLLRLAIEAAYDCGTRKPLKLTRYGRGLARGGGYSGGARCGETWQAAVLLNESWFALNRSSG